MQHGEKCSLAFPRVLTSAVNGVGCGLRIVIPMTMRVRRGVDRLRDDAGKFKFQRVDWYSWRLRVDRAWMSFVMYLYVQCPTD